MGHIQEQWPRKQHNYLRFGMCKQMYINSVGTKTKVTSQILKHDNSF